MLTCRVRGITDGVLFPDECYKFVKFSGTGGECAKRDLEADDLSALIFTQTYSPKPGTVVMRVDHFQGVGDVMYPVMILGGEARTSSRNDVQSYQCMVTIINPHSNHRQITTETTGVDTHPRLYIPDPISGYFIEEPTEPVTIVFP